MTRAWGGEPAEEREPLAGKAPEHGGGHAAQMRNPAAVGPGRVQVPGRVTPGPACVWIPRSIQSRASGSPRRAA